MSDYESLLKACLLVFATILLCTVWFRWADAATATHADCVAYWTRRTASWVNAPSRAQIYNNDLYCGNVA